MSRRSEPDDEAASDPGAPASRTEPIAFFHRATDARGALFPDPREDRTAPAQAPDDGSVAEVGDFLLVRSDRADSAVHTLFDRAASGVRQTGPS